MRRSRWMGLVLATFLTGCRTAEERQMQAFLDRHVAVVDPLSTQANRVMYAAEVSGSAEHFEQLRQLRLQLNDIYTNRQDLALLERLNDSGRVTEPRLKRQLDKLHLAYLGSRMDQDLLRQTIELSTAITERYNNFRGTIDGQPVTMSDIYRILTTEPNVELRRKAWLASKQVGHAIIDDYLRLVRMRNRAVQQIGFDNYHTFALTTSEQDVAQVDAVMAELDQLTAGPFTRLKNELDRTLARGYGIDVQDLRPWHYHDPFFQRTPLVYQVDLDATYARHDVVQLCREYFAGVGLPVDDILTRSDLYDKPGKNPHAFAQDVDRHGDVRILANVNNDERWMETTLHELGHAVYAKYHDPSEPYLLREPAHAFTTEAAAMFFGRLSRNPAWMQAMLHLTDEQRAELEDATARYLRFGQILFARWALVMWHFEKAVYANPDQDLNRLWWDLVERYQQLHRPDGPPDAGWASKLHFTVAPCYYHNYLLGELLASQWHHTLVHKVLGRHSDRQVSYVGDPRVGQYFRHEVFGPGAVYTWDRMIRRSTGEPLTCRYFAQQFLP